MNIYQKKYIRNWLIAISIIAFIALNIWALATGIEVVKAVWLGVFVLLGVVSIFACIYGFIAEQIYSFRLRGVCENDEELNFLCRYDYALHQDKLTENMFYDENDRLLVKRFLSVKRPKWY